MNLKWYETTIDVELLFSFCCFLYCTSYAHEYNHKFIIIISIRHIVTSDMPVIQFCELRRL